MQIHQFEFRAMASPCEIKLGCIGRENAKNIARAAELEVRRIEDKYSRFKTDNIVSRINRHAFESAIEIDAETEALFSYADRLFQLSDGLFDITTGSLQTAWDFNTGRIPTEAELREKLSCVGWQFVECLNGAIRFRNPGIRIDFGGFGKEYAADRAAGVLTELGAISGYVDLGGDIRVIGPKPDASPWQIGVRHPRKPKVIFAGIPVSSGGFATSGDYERYFEKDGEHYCHILLPHTGWPVRYWQSVSVMAPLTTTAGATCTIAMLKQKEGLDFLHECGLPFLAIDFNGLPHTHHAKT